MTKALRITILIALIFSTLTQAQTVNHWETAIFKDNYWRYFPGTSEPDAAWRSLSFNDSGWATGKGGFGFSDNDDNTIIPQCISVFIRVKFTVTDTSAIAKALLSMDYDDAFVAYINDKEVARSGITGIHPAYNQTGNDHEATVYRGGLPENFIINKEQLKICLLQGENVLAIQVHNSSATSSDMSSNAYLSFGIANTSTFFNQIPSWLNPPMDFSSSDLPLVAITTAPGQVISDEPKITADMKIIFNGAGKRNMLSDSGNVYTGKVGIEIRGKYSASLPQKPYGFETRDSLGNNLDVSLLGMPAENDWVLLANYNDKTFLRNVLAFDIFKKMGNYAPRMRFCEVVVNDEYQGIFLLGEKIKIDDGRVDIHGMTPFDNQGDEVTGGYIIKNDYFFGGDSWLSGFSPLNKPFEDVYFVYHDPKPEDLTEAQRNYIKDFYNKLETSLYGPYFKVPGAGYKEFIDINSFADYFLLGEITRNVDAYKKSRFFFKDKNKKDELLHSGPPWDFDWAWRNLYENCIHMNQTDGSGWAYKINECEAWPVPPSWEVRMLQDNEFASLIHSKYFGWRKTILSQAQLDSTIDSVANLLNESQDRHFQKWKTLGINAGTPESGIQPLTFEGEIEKFKSWISIRLAWLDKNLAGYDTKGNEIVTGVSCRLFPNPVSDDLTIQANKEINTITIYNSSGTLMDKQTEIFNYLSIINVTHFSPGLYLVRIELSSREVVTIKMIKN
jgi:hypothetical protein